MPKEIRLSASPVHASRFAVMKHRQRMVFLFLLAGLFITQCKQEGAKTIEQHALIESFIDTSYDLLLVDAAGSKKYALRALQEAKAAGYLAGEADAMGQLGLYYSCYGQLDSAQYLIRKALDFKRKSGNKRSIAFALSNLGEVYQEAGLFKESAIAADSALMLLRELKDTTYMLRVMQQRAVLERDKGNWQEAKRLFHANMALAEIWGEPEALATCTKSLGSIYDETGSFDSAIYWCKESVRWHNEIEDPTSAMTLWMNMSRMYMDQGKFPEARETMARALTFFHAGVGGTLDSLAMQHNMLLLELRTQCDSVLVEQLLDYLDAEKKYYKTNAANEMAQLEAAYQLRARQEQNRLLQEENRERGYLLAAAGVLTLLVSLIFWLYFVNTRNKQRLIANEMMMKDAAIEKMMQDHELNAVNAALSGQDEERGRIAQELHDRLGHILSVAKLNFSTLQDGLQKLEERNQQSYHQVARMLDEAADEVRRISHDLYGSSVMNFGITTALHQLADAVSASNNLTVQFHAFGVPPDIQLETQMNLYRIAGELLSNSIKYAKATRIDLQLLTRDDKVILGYEDDGRGFDPGSIDKTPGIGYRNIKARLQKIHGTYILESRPGKGMYFEAEVPIHGWHPAGSTPS